MKSEYQESKKILEKLKSSVTKAYEKAYDISGPNSFEAGSSERTELCEILDILDKEIYHKKFHEFYHEMLKDKEHQNDILKARIEVYKEAIRKNKDS